MHDISLITTIVAGLCLAFLFGAAAQRLRIPPLVGYLLAGVAVGPFTPGFVADLELAPQLAEIGVILLMFGVGLHFSLKDLLSVRAIAVPGAVVQIGIATAMGVGLGWMMGWPFGNGVVFGLALSVASTVVLLRALQERHLVQTERGRIAVGWLVIEDLAMVLALVLLPALASVLGGQPPEGPAATGLNALARDFGLELGLDLDLGLTGVIGLTLLKVAAFIGVMLIAGRRIIPWILHETAHTGSRELFRLAVLAIALGVAFGAAELFGVSLALGAFFAGMVLSESALSHRAAEESLPLRDAFAVLFFVSVGMLFDPEIVLRSPVPVLATVFIIVIGKSAAAYLIVRAFRHPPGTALTISASLAQIGEFSFILAGLGLDLGLLTAEARDLILAGAILSIFLNPLAFAAIDRLERRAAQRRPAPPPAPAAETERAPAAREPEPEPPSPPAGHVVLIGHGLVGSLIGDFLKASGAPYVVIEVDDALAAGLAAGGARVVIGNAASAEVLAEAEIGTARQLIVAIPDAFEAGQVVQQARAANPDLAIVARADADAEAEHLASLGARSVITGERELARGMIEQLRRWNEGPA